MRMAKRSDHGLNNVAPVILLSYNDVCDFTEEQSSFFDETTCEIADGLQQREDSGSAGLSRSSMCSLNDCARTLDSQYRSHK